MGGKGSFIFFEKVGILLVKINIVFQGGKFHFFEKLPVPSPFSME